MKTITKILGEPQKSNSSSGKYAVPVEFEYTYNNGIKKTMDGFQYFWTAKKANQLYKETKLPCIVTFN